MKSFMTLFKFSVAIAIGAWLFLYSSSDKEQTNANKTLEERPLTKHEIQRMNLMRIRSELAEKQQTLNGDLQEVTVLDAPMIVDTGEVITVDPSKVNLGTVITYNLLKKTKLDMKKLPPVFPEKLLALNGKEVTILSFMAPLNQIDDANHFLLIPQPKSCYYCSGSPTLLDLIYVKLKDGSTTSILDGPVKVTGRLKLLSGSTPLKERKGGYDNKLVFSLLESTATEATQDGISVFLSLVKQLEPEEKQQLETNHNTHKARR